MNTIGKLATALAVAYIVLNVGFFLFSTAFAQDEILPMNAPTVHTKTIKIATAEERSTILIHDIWKQPELDRVKIGNGAAIGLIKRVVPVAPIEPYGWQAYVSQDAISSYNGGIDAIAYGGL